MWFLFLGAEVVDIQAVVCIIIYSLKPNVRTMNMTINYQENFNVKSKLLGEANRLGFRLSKLTQDFESCNSRVFAISERASKRALRRYDAVVEAGELLMQHLRHDSGSTHQGG